MWMSVWLMLTGRWNDVAVAAVAAFVVAAAVVVAVAVGAVAA